MKVVPRDKAIYSFSPENESVEHVKLGEHVLLQTEDAFGGQINSEKDSVAELDWSKVDGATGPLYIEKASPGDTLVVEILDIRIPENGVIATIPKQGILGRKRFKPTTRAVRIDDDYIHFDGNVRIRANPMIGTIGVTPKDHEIACSSLGEHGGNMDVKELNVGTKLYLPVFVKGALFAAGDVHVTQADGELCVSAIEVPSEILVRFDLIEAKKPDWPVLETRDSYAFLACGETLDEAAECATQAAVQSIMRQYDWSFETAYMFGSLVVDLRINQVVDPKKGVRAVMSKDFVNLDSLLV